MLHVVKSWERSFGGAHTQTTSIVLFRFSPRATSRRRCKGTRRAKEEGIINLVQGRSFAAGFDSSPRHDFFSLNSL
nr:MAG TPA: hypothetical protein [Caudoviricetes sp.]